MYSFFGCLFDYPQERNAEGNRTMEEVDLSIHHQVSDNQDCYSDEYVHFSYSRLNHNDIEDEYQPMSYENNRYWILFIGKIYNYIELRERLINEGAVFTTESDTEVIAALYSKLQERVVHHLRGMFSFVIWDKVTQTLFGARDHFGIKPFFYSEQDKITYFASDKKSILPAVNGKLDTESLQHYLSFQYVPEPHTLTEEIKKLEPGFYFIKKPNSKMKIKSYWTPSFKPQVMSDAQLTNEVREVLMDSVNKHMSSDVPVGSFLSGGIDSSFIVSLAKKLKPNIKTFTVGFEQEKYSEIFVAQETAEALGVENINYVISPEEYIAELPKIIRHTEDPLADPAAIPLYFAAREASKHVKVVLSGEGADELFGGYNIYREPQSLKIFRYLPNSIKRVLNKLNHILPDGIKGKSFIERGITPLEERYIGNAKIFEESEKKSLLANFNHNIDYSTITKPIYSQSQLYDTVTRMQHLDIHTWLRGDILLKANRMTMAHSLELRVPFLDKEVFKVARKVNTNQKINNRTTKYILRKAAEGIVPEHVLNRKKLGFPVPIRHWFKNEIYDWTKELIQISQTDYLFNKVKIYQLLEEHVTNKRDNSRKLWTIIVFMIWHQIFIETHNEPSIEKETLAMLTS